MIDFLNKIFDSKIYTDKKYLNLDIKYPEKKNNYLLISSLLYLIPTYLLYKKKIYILSLFLCLTSICSTISDNIIKNSIFVLLDRYIAIICYLLLIYYAFKNNISFIEIIFLLLLTLYFLYKSRISKDYNEYVKNHIIWHIISMSVIIYLVYKF